MGLDIAPLGQPMIERSFQLPGRMATTRRLVARLSSATRWRRCAALLFTIPHDPSLESGETLEHAAMSLWYCPHRLTREPESR